MGWLSALRHRQTAKVGLLVTISLLLAAVMATGSAFGETATCDNPNSLAIQTLSGSRFEIDTNANLKVDDPDCIDWLDGTTEGSPMRGGVVAQEDVAVGQDDNSFVQGSKEDTTDPVIEFGGIPPNKSDLSWFGIFTEQNPPVPPDGYLELFWSRIQDPSGTTNMDFELNQKFCDDEAANDPDCSANGVTPIRTGNGTAPGVDDILITYDLSRGGTQATISIRKWTGTQWGPADALNATEAVGTINSTRIGTSPLVTDVNPTGSLDPRTFGEAAVTFDALFGESGCGSFGSAYLKSRSSDSFQAALKDFVPPTEVEIGNCPSGLTTTATTPVAFGQPISDTAHLTEVPVDAGGTITFHLWPSVAECEAGTNEITTGLTPVTVSGPGDYPSGDFTPATAGDYFWTAEYSGDDSPATAPDETACGEAGETSIVNQQPSSLTTTQRYIPQDTATLTGTGTYNGELVFNLFTSLANCQAADNDNLDVYTETVDVPAGTTAGASFTTNNDGVPADESSTDNDTDAGYGITDTVDNTPHFWEVIYQGDSVRANATSACVEDSTAFMVDDTTAPGTT